MHRLLALFADHPVAADLSMHVAIAGVAALVGAHKIAADRLALVKDIPLTTHGRCDFLAAHVLAAVMNGTRCEDSTLNELVALNERLSGRPGQEDATVSIALALDQRGKMAEARALVRAYRMKNRREMYPARHPLLSKFAD
jgi:hypothetical protein